MNFKCSNCGYRLTADAPPETCPYCNSKCSFVDDSCYTPECGLAEKK
ncbi:rubredoxin-like domain-containing protein [Zhaonella formicivorans]